MAEEDPSFSIEEESTSLGFEISPERRFKTETLAKSLSGKGKEKIDPQGEEEEEKIESLVCGICFSEEDARSIRGRIDSCDHYFCFVCIMEWAKVESRCPMCKQRFKSIHRPLQQGVSLRERLINVPVRNQVYDHLGNQTVSLSDPYADVVCHECDSAGDDNLLLLCDLCDSAAHTYCVGLGVTVPEEEWYCSDCAVLMSEHSCVEKYSDSLEIEFLPRFDTTQEAEAAVSISDIVQEETFSDEFRLQRQSRHSLRRKRTEEVSEPRRRVSRKESQGTSCSGQSTSHEIIARKIKSSNSELRKPEQGARTLSRCRNLHDNIRILRESWSDLRNGSVIFSSGGTRTGGRNSSRIVSDQTSQLQSVASVKLINKGSVSNDRETENLAEKDGISNGRDNNGDTYDIDRAWKMMQAAKSLKGDNTKNCSFDKINAQKEPKNKTSSSSGPKTKPFERKDLGTVALQKNYKRYFIEVVNNKGRSETVEKQKNTGINEKQTLKSVNMGSHWENGEQMPRQVLYGAPQLVNSQDLLPCSGRVSDSRTQVSGLSFTRSKPVTSSVSKIEPSLANCVVDANLLVGEEAVPRKDDVNKSHIQSLVKLNLKLMSKGKPLDVDRFKEIARLATHTILAACGLEHSRSSVRLCPALTCEHSKQQKPFCPSNLIPNCCRECFYFFIKDVINTIMADKAQLV